MKTAAPITQTHGEVYHSVDVVVVVVILVEEEELPDSEAPPLSCAHKAVCIKAMVNNIKNAL
jgi:hypothetical protein